MRFKGIFVASILALVFSSAAFAQEVQVDTSGLSNEQKAQLVLQAEKMKKESEKGVVDKVTENLTNPNKLNEWVELGKNAGLALTAMAKELGVASDQILKSDTGKIAMALIIWKIMGRDIVDLIGGVAMWFVIAPIILWSFHFFHMTKREKSKEGVVRYNKRYEFQSNEARNASAIFHALSFFTLTFLTAVIVFG